MLFRSVLRWMPNKATKTAPPNCSASTAKPSNANSKNTASANHPPPYPAFTIHPQLVMPDTSNRASIFLLEEVVILIHSTSLRTRATEGSSQAVGLSPSRHKLFPLIPPPSRSYPTVAIKPPFSLLHHARQSLSGIHPLHSFLPAILALFWKSLNGSSSIVFYRPTPAGWPKGGTLFSASGPCLSRASWFAFLRVGVPPLQ